jgi:DNA transformation protein and related proteins
LCRSANGSLGVSVSSSFRTFVLDQLGRSTPAIRARSMFGGVGVYAADLFFALMADDTLYFKVDDQTRPDFEQREMKPFRPYGEGGEVMQYYEVPADVLEDPETLARWVNAAVGVAHRARQSRPPRRSR